MNSTNPIPMALWHLFDEIKYLYLKIKSTEYCYEIIDKCGGLKNTFNSDINDFLKIDGIGNAKALKLVTISELFKRYNLKGRPVNKFVGYEDLYHKIKYKFIDVDKEMVYLIGIGKNKDINVDGIPGKYWWKSLLNSIHRCSSKMCLNGLCII